MRALLLDAMGTLLTFEPPAPHLRAALLARLGVDVGEEAARAAIAAEIAYYRAHLHEGRDAAGLAALRRASAEAMRPRCPAAAGADGELLTAALLDALRFVAYPEVPAALRALRALGLRLVVVSNWDVSLHERLEETGLAPLVDGAVASAVVGVAKPEPAIFARGLALAGVPRRRRRGTSGTRRRPTSPARWRPGSSRCSWRATAARPRAARGADDRLAGRASRAVRVTLDAE